MDGMAPEGKSPATFNGVFGGHPKRCWILFHENCEKSRKITKKMFEE